MDSGIYKIVNKKNSKCYVGSAFNFDKRFVLHRHYLNRNKHHSIKLQRAWNKYGAENFEFQIIEVCSKKVISKREEFYIKCCNSYHKGYNCSPFASGHSPKLKESTKKKISVAAQRVASDEEERQRRSERAKKQHAEGKLGKKTFKNGGPSSEKISKGLKQSAKFKAHYKKLRAAQTPEEMSRRSYCRKIFLEPLNETHSA